MNALIIRSRLEINTVNACVYRLYAGFGKNRSKAVFPADCGIFGTFVSSSIESFNSARDISYSSAFLGVFSSPEATLHALYQQK